MRGCGMRRIAQAQDWPTDAELNLIVIKQRNRLGNALAVHERAVETFQIIENELLIGLMNFSMPARNHGGIGIDDHIAFGVATQSRDVGIEIEVPRLTGAGINQI